VRFRERFLKTFNKNIFKYMHTHTHKINSTYLPQTLANNQLMLNVVLTSCLASPVAASLPRMDHSRPLVFMGRSIPGYQ
jgi:hypothetical protein